MRDKIQFDSYRKNESQFNKYRLLTTGIAEKIFDVFKRLTLKLLPGHISVDCDPLRFAF